MVDIDKLRKLAAKANPDLVETLVRRAYSKHPQRTFSENLCKETGLALNKAISYDLFIKLGGNDDGLRNMLLECLEAIYDEFDFRALLDEHEALRKASIALRDDLLHRAEWDGDALKVVCADNSAWYNFNEAIGN